VRNRGAIPTRSAAALPLSVPSYCGYQKLRKRTGKGPCLARMPTRPHHRHRVSAPMIPVLQAIFSQEHRTKETRRTPSLNLLHSEDSRNSSVIARRTTLLGRWKMPGRLTRTQRRKYRLKQAPHVGCFGVLSESAPEIGTRWRSGVNSNSGTAHQEGHRGQPAFSERIYDQGPAILLLN
jgi:hypothetical protein